MWQRLSRTSAAVGDAFWPKIALGRARLRELWHPKVAAAQQKQQAQPVTHACDMARDVNRPAAGMVPKAVVLCLAVVAAASTVSCQQQQPLPASLAAAREMLATGRFGDALRVASTGAEEARSNREPSLDRERLLLLMVASEAADSLRLDQTAFRLHQDAVVLAQRLAGQKGPARLADQRRLLQAWAALSESLRARGNHSAALRAVARAQQSLIALEQMHGRRLQDLRAVVGLLAADASDCAGDAQAALAHFEAATPGRQLSGPPPVNDYGSKQAGARPAPVRSLSRHLALLGRSAAFLLESGRPEDARTLWERWGAAAAAGVASGMVPSVWQAPGSWEPGLLSRPWHSSGRRSGWRLASTKRALARIQRVLTAAAPALSIEWRSLRRGSGTSQQSECLHYLAAPLAGTEQEGRGPAPLAPEWRQYSASGYWHDEGSGRTDTVENDALAAWAASLANVAQNRIRLPWPCSSESPVLCAVTAAVVAAGTEAGTGRAGDSPPVTAEQPAGIQVLRTGYSELGPRTSLRAHHGRSNGQLKMHLGIDVPTPTAAEQRALRGKSVLGSRTLRGGLECGRTSCEMVPANRSRSCRRASPNCEGQPVAVADPWSTGAVSESHCAALRVSGPDDARSGPASIVGDWQPWGNGQVLFFDDSFLHEVANVCSRPRVVVQIVLKHPWLTTGGKPGSAISGA